MTHLPVPLQGRRAVLEQGIACAVQLLQVTAGGRAHRGTAQHQRCAHGSQHLRIHRIGLGLTAHGLCEAACTHGMDTGQHQRVGQGLFQSPVDSYTTHRTGGVIHSARHAMPPAVLSKRAVRREGSSYASRCALLMSMPTVFGVSCCMLSLLLCLSCEP